MGGQLRPVAFAPKGAAHADRRFATLVVARQMADGPVAHALVERLRPDVAGAHFERNAGDAGNDGAFLHPFEQPPADAVTPMPVRDAERVETRVLYLGRRAEVREGAPIP
jgi:hypothetical protein